MWGGLGQAATVAQLVGADVGGLISMIMQAALTARQNKKECEQLARRVFMIAELLPHLQDPEVMRRPEVRRPLVGLDETLREAHELVMSCQEKSAAYRLVMAWRQAERFREVQSSIDSYLLVFPFISHIDITCRLDRIYNILLPNDSTAPPAGSRIQEFAAVAQQVVVHGDSCEEFTLAVLAAATNNFASATMIGQGGFGGVYKGTLPDGRKVAIKRKTMESLQGDSQFHAEITSLSSIHHNHVVRLYGYCAVGEERMLVYEYAENGSLDDHLHGRRSSSSSSSPVTASWKMRFEVLLGLSRAVEHLQSYPERRVIHRDIKSSNVLLDASWAPILTDFGISLTVDETDCENGVDVPVRGTYGYAAPEYIATGILKPTSDVYSLGVVMLEVLTGKRAMFRRDDTGNADALGGQESLVCFALPIIEAGTVWKVLDKRPTRSPTRRQLKAANLVARMAARCLRHQEYTRPPLPEVVSVLEKAVELARGDDDRAVRRYFSELR